MVDERWHDPRLPAAERVEALLDAMTIEEKLAQLGSFWPPRTDADADGEVAPMQNAMRSGPQTLDEATAHGLGHLTRPFGTRPVEPRTGAAELEAAQRRLVADTRLGIPAIAHEECLTGFTTLGATVYPTPLAWAATFDPGLIERMGAAIGADMRAVGVHQGLAPVLDVVRDYRWGRVEETMGEDPYLVAVTGTAYVRGLEGAGIIATLKHFAGYSASRAARNHAPVPMGPREFADVILPPFEMAVRLGGARSVMNSYTDVDGMPVAANRELLTGILRGQWGFTGTVVSDYWSVPFLDLMHRVSADRADSGALAIRAGIDVELPSSDAFRLLAGKVAAGELEEAVVDEAARRVLAQKCELGLLDAEPRLAAPDPGRDLDGPANRSLAAEVAEESIVLCANDGVLPLRANDSARPSGANDRVPPPGSGDGVLPPGADDGGLSSGADPRRIALIGPTSADPRTLLGCYSFPNHVLARFAGDANGMEIPSLLEALREELPAAEIVHEPGVPIREADRSGIARAVRAAAAADVCVLAVGDLASLFGRGTSGEGCDVPDVSLPGIQAELVDAVLTTGTPTVLVVVAGRPYALGGLADRCAAVVQAFLPGVAGGRAIAGVLSGRVDPSGRLPVGIPREPGGMPTTYLAPPLGRDSSGVSNIDPSPLYPFGHGLGYTTFDYGDLLLDNDSITATGEVRASLAVTNTGSRPGSTVVQLYLSDEVAHVTRPVRELVGFARLRLDPGRSRTVTFTLHADRTAFTGADLARVIEPGWFTLAAGGSSENLPATARFAITTGAEIAPGRRVLTTPVTLGE